MYGLESISACTEREITHNIFFFPIYFGERERVRDHGGLPTMPTETRLSDGNFICCSWALLFLN